MVKVIIEDAIVEVCNSCSSYGQKIAEIAKPVVEQSKNKEDDDFEFVDNFGEIIKNAREKVGISRKDFAEKIKQSEKLIKKIESGDLKPDFELARKIEKELGIKILEKADSNYQKKDYKKSELTIGDVVEID
ncbi:MAG: TIGR00270 family protein [Candidatus Aenigmarchaeota archaeon]|nr:TIGR00270 family protein [Candidatus Aenigmarchaeota archaeon]